jgi:AcrR family transcriptional regulator
MAPRRPSVNAEMRRRSRERLLEATVRVIETRGYEAATLSDIAERAGTARGLVSYYFPTKRQLLQSATHRLMRLELAAALEHEPTPPQGPEALARAIDCVLGLPVRHPVLMRAHMAAILQEEGFIQCPEQRLLAGLLRGAVIAWGSPDPERDYRMLRAQLMGAVFTQLIPGAPMPLSLLRADLFQRYGLAWYLGDPPAAGPADGTTLPSGSGPGEG